MANLFSDAYLGAWSGISLVLFAMKFFAVAAATNATVAALVLCVSVLTALLWFGAFVLVGSEDHRRCTARCPSGNSRRRSGSAPSRVRSGSTPCARSSARP